MTTVDTLEVTASPSPSAGVVGAVVDEGRRSAACDAREGEVKETVFL